MLALASRAYDGEQGEPRYMEIEATLHIHHSTDNNAAVLR